VERVAGRGRKAEFLALLEPVKDALARYAYRNVRSGPDAPDVVQEAVTIAWREFDRFQSGTNFRAWVFKILVHAVYRFNKRHRRQRRETDIPSFELDAVSLPREQAWESILEDPERVLEELDERVVSALQTLGANERQCLLLRLLEGFTYREIAEMLDVPLGTVMSHVHRARMKLREQLAELAIEQGLVAEAQA
jgi:RNA polymerase sigma-70 factor (ECF subfamily)